jgi:hypothetical protein
LKIYRWGRGRKIDEHKVEQKGAKNGALGDSIFYFTRLGDVTTEADTDRPVLEEVLEPAQAISREADFREFVEKTFCP